MEKCCATSPVSDDEDWFFNRDIMDFFIIFSFLSNSKRGGEKNHYGDVEEFRDELPINLESVFNEYLYPGNKR